MKKKSTAMVLLMLAMGTLSAAFMPIPGKGEDPLFSSPALVINAEEDIDAHLSASWGSDISALSFMSDPVKGLDSAAMHLSETLASKDLSFWQKNGDIIALFSSIDPENFPADLSDGEHALSQLRMYFRNVYTSDAFGSVNRAHAAASLAESHPELFPFDSSPLLGGDFALATGVWGLHAHDGFAWKWDVDLSYRTAESLLRGKGYLRLESGVSAGYAFNLFTPSFAAGIAARPSIIFDNIQNGPAFIKGRMDADVIGVFTEPMRIGTGISLDLGLMWQASPTLLFTLDFRNVPSFSSYFCWPLTNLAEGSFMPERDRNIYYEAPDAAITAVYDSGTLRFRAEVAHILDQLLWTESLEGYEFNYYRVLDLSVAWTIQEDLTLNTRLGDEMLTVGVEWQDLSAEISTKLDRGYIGLSFGYEW